MQVYVFGMFPSLCRAVIYSVQTDSYMPKHGSLITILHPGFESTSLHTTSIRYT